MKVTWEELTLKPDPVHGLPLARSSHGVSVVQQGTALIVYGGENVARTPITAVPSLWKADLVNQQWHALLPPESSSPGLAPSPRVAHAQAVHKDNTVYVFGGRNGIDMHETALDDLWAYHVEQNTWTLIEPAGAAGDDDTTTTKPPARSFHRMICVQDSLYVFGGCGKQGRLADLYCFDIPTRTWKALPVSNLRGRGGPNFTAIPNTASSSNNDATTASPSLLVLAGFAGEETCDGQIYHVQPGVWQEPVFTCTELRPRSVCVAGTVQVETSKQVVVVLFGGEVNPSDRGHEGAGGFAKDVVVVVPEETTNEGDAKTITNLKFIQGDALEIQAATATNGEAQPSARGWSAGDTYQNSLYLFGGLAGDDAAPIRLGDLWKLTLSD